MNRSILALGLAFAIFGFAFLSCGDEPAQPGCGNGIKEPGEECDDGNRWNNDGCSSVCMLEIAHTVLYANVGINRNVVPGYPGDGCSSVAKRLVIEGSGPDGFTLEHKELDCALGYNGWPFYDIPGGHYVVTMQIFDVDTGGRMVALTPPRDAAIDVVPGIENTVYVDFDYRDFSTSYTGTLRWRYTWMPGSPPDGGVADGGLPDGGVLAGVGCAAATPPVQQVRITLRSETDQIVNEQTNLGTKTNGSEKSPCHDFGSSDAEVASGLPWGIYRITLEGFDATGKVAYCSFRDLFVTKGDGVIFSLTGLPGTCR